MLCFISTGLSAEFGVSGPKAILLHSLKHLQNFLRAPFSLHAASLVILNGALLHVENNAAPEQLFQCCDGDWGHIIRDQVCCFAHSSYSFNLNGVLHTMHT